MSNKELLEKLLENGNVWFELPISEEGQKLFIDWAVENKLFWLDGSEVKPEQVCAYHVAVHPDHKIANIAMFAWVSPITRNQKKYNFQKFLEGEIVEVDPTLWKGCMITK